MALDYSSEPQKSDLIETIKDDRIIIPVRDEFSVYSVRKQVLATAESTGMHPQELGELEIIVSEMVSNILKHGGNKGTVTIRKSVANGEPDGIILDFIDEGPGLHSLSRAVENGYSTTGTMGGGLSAVQRLADSLELLPEKGTGTHLRVTKKRSSTISNNDKWEFAFFSRPYPLEKECGDQGAIFRDQMGIIAILADGLGHGDEAARAAKAAIDTVRDYLHMGTVDLIKILHRNLRSTRGAAVSIVRIEPGKEELEWIGIGNVNGRLFYGKPREGKTEQLFVNQNGTVGARITNIHPMKYHFLPGDRLVLVSDGLKSNWFRIFYRENPGRMPLRDLGHLILHEAARENDDASILLGRVHP